MVPRVFRPAEPSPRAAWPQRRVVLRPLRAREESTVSRRLDQVVIQWDERTRVTLTVRVCRDGRLPQGPERRLAEEIAACLWLAYHQAAMEVNP